MIESKGAYPSLSLRLTMSSVVTLATKEAARETPVVRVASDEPLGMQVVLASPGADPPET